jgi:hypothetical protein
MGLKEGQAKHKTTPRSNIHRIHKTKETPTHIKRIRVYGFIDKVERLAEEI